MSSEFKMEYLPQQHDPRAEERKQLCTRHKDHALPGEIALGKKYEMFIGGDGNFFICPPGLYDHVKCLVCRDLNLQKTRSTGQIQMVLDLPPINFPEPKNEESK